MTRMETDRCVTTVLQALSTVYGYPLTNCTTGSSPWNRDDECVFCEICATFVTQFYQTYLEIRKLAFAQSYVSLGIKQIQDCVANSFLTTREEEASSNPNETTVCDATPGQPQQTKSNSGTTTEEQASNVRQGCSDLAIVKVETLQSDFHESLDEYEDIDNDNASDWEPEETHVSGISQTNTLQESEISTRMTTRLRKNRSEDEKDRSNAPTVITKRKALEMDPSFESVSPPKRTLPGPGDCKCEKDNCICQCWCAICNQRFVESINLLHHVKSEHGDDGKGSPKHNHTCPRCFIEDVQTESIFSNYEELKRHCAKEHNETVNWCNKCGKSFCSDEYRREHRERVHSQPEETIGDDTELEPGEIPDEDLQESCKCAHCDQEFERYHQLIKHYLEHNDVKPKFGCTKCAKIFFRHGTLKRHIPVHSWKAMLTCDDCGKQFERQDHLDRHIISMHNPNHTKAPKTIRKPAGPKQKKKRIWKPRIRTRKPKKKVEKLPKKEMDELREMPIKVKARKILETPCADCFNLECDCLCKCTVCCRKFPTSIALYHHVKSEHNEDGTSTNKRTLTCPMCVTTDIKTGSIFVNYDHLKSHYLKEHKETINWCTACGKSFRSQDHLRNHRKRVHEAPPIEGEESKVEPLAQELEPGEKDTPEDEKTFKCNHCNQDFQRKHQLTKHLLSHNEVKPKFGCAICTKAFFRDDSLRRHIPMHTWRELVTCPECGKKFERQYHLNRHMISQHDPNRAKEPKPKVVPKAEKVPRQPLPLTCTICNKTFGRHENLKLHMRIHTDEKSHLCTICGKTFRDNRNLNQHYITHKNDRPFCCSVCGVTFKRAHHLSGHEKTHRTDIPRPFVCKVENCGKTFMLKKHLLSHKLVHSGVKDFSCHVCGRAFNRKDNLTQHIIKLHGKQFAEDLKPVVEQQRVNQQRVLQTETRDSSNSNSINTNQPAKIDGVSEPGIVEILMG